MAAPGLWDYSEWRGREAKPYGSADTYEIGVSWLDETCESIEDWGGALTYAKRYVRNASYYAIDGSPSAAEWCDEIQDLRERHSSPDGVFMRHILEHNRDWAVILDNAVGSFRKRMVLVMFVPFSPFTHATQNWEILDQSFARQDLVDHFAPFLHHEQTLETDTQYRWEHVFFLEKPQEEGSHDQPGVSDSTGEGTAS